MTSMGKGIIDLGYKWGRERKSNASKEGVSQSDSNGHKVIDGSEGKRALHSGQRVISGIDVLS